MYGWDVVYACSGDYLNRQLEDDADKLIQSFSYEDSDIKVSGTFGPWKIVPGGGGRLLQFETPIVKGQATFKLEDEVTIELDGAVPLVQMQLQLAKGKDQSVVQQLVFHCTTAGTKPGDTHPGAVTVVSPDTSGKLRADNPDVSANDLKIGADLLKAALTGVFIQNNDQLNLVFAEQLPVPTGESSSWLKPVVSTYAYQQPIDGALGGVAILGMLSETNIDSLPRNFPTGLLDGTQDFGFMLSGAQFMEHVIQPALPRAFRGNCDAGDFRYDSSTGVLGLGRDFNLDSVEVGLIDYTPEVQSFSYEIEDSAMSCFVATRTDITGLTDAYVTNSVTSKNPATFDPETRSLSFEPDPHQSTTQDTHIPCWEKIVGALTLGIMNAVIGAVSLAIENAAGDATSSKTADALGQVAPGLVTWSGQKSLTIDAGGLADNVYMTGVLD
jgi:hypothetical protein